MTCALPLNDPNRGAEFSVDRGHRYRLWHIWGAQPSACFLMLNPSIANETDLDPTLRRCVGFARSFGYGGLLVVNLFTVASPEPRVILGYPDAEGDEPRRTTLGRIVTNRQVILEVAETAGIVLAGWGAFPAAKRRAIEVQTLLRNAGVQLQCLGTTKDGHPRHPLYLPATAKPIPFGGFDG